MADGLYAFGSLETVEIPSAGPQAANDLVAKAPLGILYRHKGATYRYVKFDNGTHNVAAVAAGVAYWKTLSPSTGVFTATSDQSDSLAAVNGVAGILGCVVTDQYYTWLTVGGVVTALTAASTVAGDMCTGGATDMTFARIAAGQALTNVCFAIALDTRDDTAGTNTVLLQNLDW